jgi:nitrogen fixation NifU-like protein
MTEALVGLSTADAEALAERFHALVTVPGASLAPPHEALTIFAHVRDFPTRIRCAELAWETLRQALRGQVAAPR